MKPASVLGLLLCVFEASAFAGASPVAFTAEEIQANLANSKLISETASSCLQRAWDEHNKFFKQRSYSKFYGNRHPKHKTAAGRKAVLLSLLPKLEPKVMANDPAALKELESREEELMAMSCIGLAMQCLGEGFEKAGMNDTWEKIRNWVGRTEDGALMFYGTDLQKALVDLGWKALYWNPDTAQNEVWDEIDKDKNPLKEGKEWNPIWGGHAYRFALVKKNREYYGVPVHDVQTLVNFGISPPEEFKQAPFFVGTAHAGYHVFPGFNGQVIEAHSMRELNSASNLEVGPFNPLFQDHNGVSSGNGAPRWTRIEHYKSGVIVVPPGFIAEKPFVFPGPAPENTPRATPPAPREDEVEEDSSRRRRPRPEDYERDYDDDWDPFSDRRSSSRRSRDRAIPDWLR
jgi:hypothetical protein